MERLSYKFRRTTIILALLAVGCKQTPEKKMELREITELANGEDGFQDIGLLITDTKKEDDRLIFTGLGLFKGDTVGLGFKTNTRFDPGLIPGGGMNPEKGFSKDAVQVFSLGKQSNNFVKALSTLYGLPTNKEFANKPLIASAFSLNDQEVDLGKPNGYNKFKLFFSEDSDTLYCELFFNINYESRTIELSEKDLEFRVNILKLLTR